VCGSVLLLSEGDAFVLQCVTVLQCVAALLGQHMFVAACCSMLQCVAALCCCSLSARHVCRSMLLCVAAL